MSSETNQTTGDVLSYIATEQADFLNLLESSYAEKKITKTFYEDALSRKCETDDMDTALDHFARQYDDLAEQLQNQHMYSIMERIDTGTAYLQRTDITGEARAKATKLMLALSEELEVLLDAK